MTIAADGKPTVLYIDSEITTRMITPGFDVSADGGRILTIRRPEQKWPDILLNVDAGRSVHCAKFGAEGEPRRQGAYRIRTVNRVVSSKVRSSV